MSNLNVFEGGCGWDHEIDDKVVVFAVSASEESLEVVPVVEWSQLLELESAQSLSCIVCLSNWWLSCSPGIEFSLQVHQTKENLVSIGRITSVLDCWTIDQSGGVSSFNCFSDIGTGGIGVLNYVSIALGKNVERRFGQESEFFGAIQRHRAAKERRVGSA